jgi:hypothetical protein
MKGIEFHTLASVFFLKVIGVVYTKTSCLVSGQRLMIEPRAEDNSQPCDLGLE